MYTMTLGWGPYTKQVDFTPPRGNPIYFLHQKTAPDLITLHVRIEPPGIVTFGQGLPPDQLTRDIGEGWERERHQSNTPAGQLTRPPGGKVNRNDTVTGVISRLPPHSQALILVQTPQENFFWPQGKLRLDQAGNFASEAIFGRVGHRDSGKEFILLLVVAPSDAAASFEYSMDKDGGMPSLPPDVLVLDKVTVTRS
jgi:hypothetical protein